MGPLMVRGDLCGSILRDRLDGIWLVATNIELQGKQVMGEPNWGSEGPQRLPLKEIFEGIPLEYYLSH